MIGKRKLLPLLAVAVWFVLLISLAVDSKTLDGIGEWQMLTKQNFSSQIRLHPHILLVVTLPWSGESRSLMKEVENVVTGRQEDYSSLKLMFMYKNTEKMLADAIGASTKETTIIYYHHSVAYKYQGRLRAQNILLSIHPMTYLPGELPLQPVHTPDDLKAFLDSTDSAFLLLEFCGWTSKLLSKMKNGTENGYGLQGDILGKITNREPSTTPKPRGKNGSKGLEIENLKCGVKNGFNGLPWLGGFSSLNESSFEETENKRSGVISSCSIEEFQRFNSFFSKFINFARDFFLPTQKYRFGWVSERSMISSLGIEDYGSWLAVLYFEACPSCSKIFREEDDLKNIKHTASIVSELEGDRTDLELALPDNKPSMILFVDRTSDSSEIRIQSKEALAAFRQLALQHHTSNQMDELSGNKVDKYSAQASTSGHPRLKLSPTAQMMKFKDKMSTVMVVSEGKHITLDKIASDLQGNSLHEIFSYLLQQKKEAKLSSLAKELGFRLLSDDMDIKLANSMPSQEEEVQSDHSPELIQEGISKNRVDPEKDQLHYKDSIHAHEHVEGSKSSTVENYSQYDEERTVYGHKTDAVISVEPDQSGASEEDRKVEGESQFRSPEEPPHVQSYKGSFLLSDGSYRLLKALTGRSKMPSLVIVDPIMHQHYVFPVEGNFSCSSQAGFLRSFLNRSLRPYQQSESVTKGPRDPVHPPFVNLDFHEVDSIPKVMTHTFHKLVLGFNQSKSKNTAHARDKDVMVLFSNSWCGFCQRMELVVREVYRAMKNYIHMLKNEDNKTVLSSDKLKDMISKLPLIYLMDCTVNDCSLILKSMDQREVYPALMLFPAKTEKALPYEGDMAVADIIKFISEHGSESKHLTREKGILWTVADSGGMSRNIFMDAEPTGIAQKSSVEKGNIHEVLLKDRITESVTRFNQIDPPTLEGTYEEAPHVVAGSILVANEKLLTVQPFEESKILIVKADENSGFQGLIINKHIRWDSLHELAEGLEMLKSAPLSLGGPLIKRKMPLVALSRSATKNQHPEILPGVFFLDQFTASHEIEELRSGNHSLTDYWFFFGYSSWGWSQLIDEIAEGAWSLADDSMKYLEWPEN